MAPPHSSLLRLSRRARAQRSSALVIALISIVLLTVLVFALLSGSLLNRQISNATSSYFVTKDFAQGAADVTIGDLQQEIAAGSTIYTNSLSSGASNNYTYQPNGPTAMVSATVGFTRSPATGVETDGLNNLIKVSAYNQPFYISGAGTPYTNSGTTATPNRASAALTTTASMDGRSVSLARWNKHLLIAKESPTSIDTTPTNSFPTPTWIMVSCTGANPTTAITGFNDPTSTNYVVGRYAYAIYDEGGLLDANVAGYPSTMTNANVVTNSVNTSSTYLNGAQVGAKTAASFADLTQIGLASADINNLVGWRNYVSATPSGAFPAYTVPSSSASNYFQTVSQSTNGFMTIANTSAGTANSDRVFPSRQSLISFFMQGLAQNNTDRANYQNALQYLGTFSRDLDQPSVWPDTNRPRVGGTYNTASSGTPALPVYYTAYQGNNDYAGLDDTVNLPFPQVLVTSPFTRFDTSTATIGEPLVKKRFPLSRLSWLTYLGPSATEFSSTPQAYQNVVLSTISQSYINQGTADDIYQCFGLTWVPPGAGATTGYWIYNHSSSATTAPSVSAGQTTVGTNQSILKLSQVAALGREPDFVELLKAAITIGSVGKGAATEESLSEPTEGPVQHFEDTTSDDQILQIFADIIDQFDPDSYPTWIKFTNGDTWNGSTPVTKDIFGIENLPYFQSTIGSLIVVKPPNPAASTAIATTGGMAFYINGDQVTGTWTTLSQGREIENGTDPVTGITQTNNAPVQDPGVAFYLVHPVIWNPHDLSSSPGNPAPTQFRFTAESKDPYGNALAPIETKFWPVLESESFASDGTFTSGPYANKLAIDQLTQVTNFPSSTTPYFTQSSSNVVLTTTNSAIYFTASATSTNFHEPVVLRIAGQPPGSDVGLSANEDNQLYSGVSIPYYPYNGAVVGAGTDGIADSQEANTGGSSNKYVGVYVGYVPLRWTDQDPYVGIAAHISSSPPTPMYNWTTSGVWCAANPSWSLPAAGPDATCRLQYQDSGGNWVTYDQKYTGNFAVQAQSFAFYGNDILGSLSGGSSPPFTGGITEEGSSGVASNWYYNFKAGLQFTDPRSPRFGSDSAAQITDYGTDGSGEPSDNVLGTIRPTQKEDWMVENGGQPGTGLTGGVNIPSQTGWNYVSPYLYHQMLAHNNPLASDNYYSDPDGVIRRGMAAYAAYSSAATVTSPAMGIPTATAYLLPTTTNGWYVSHSATSPASTMTPNVAQSRPIVLNRPFRSVADLGYTFRGDPYRNLDFMTPQSGDAALLDVFCVQDDTRTDALVSGKVNLNTRQPQVLQAILSGAYRDETQNYTALAPPLSATEATNIATALINRTSASYTSYPNKGPLMNVSQLVGKYVPNYADPLSSYYTLVNSSGSTITGGYDGFSSDLATLGLYNSSGTASANVIVQRYLETAIRSLADVGTTRTWNLLIDLVAQTGRYPATATTLDQFTVQGEQHYWVHVAIDRYTGKVIAESIEVVKE